MDFDDIALAEFEDQTDEWNAKLSRRTRELEELLTRHRGDSLPVLLKELFCGSFNFSIRAQWDDAGPDWIIRFPVPGMSVCLDEKVRKEVAVLNFLKQKTGIPVPDVVAWGTADENSLGLGPFIITTFIEGRSLSRAMKPRDESDYRESYTLDPDLPEATLEYIYRQIADFQIELSLHDFDRIGSLSHDETDRSWSVNSRPFTIKMHEIMRAGNVDVELPESGTFSTVTEYMYELDRQDRHHLEKQRNSVEDAEDARRKFVTRRIFQDLIPRFVNPEYDRGPFKLHCDDFRPGNMLIDDDFKIVGVVDWEFTYAAPFQFMYSPPRWLILTKPDKWYDYAEQGGDLFDDFKSKLELYLRVLEEQEAVRTDPPLPRPRLSSLMRQAMEDNTFWFNEVARDCFQFKNLYLSRLDSYCFPDGPSIAERMEAEDIQEGMDRLVETKLEDLRLYRIEWEEAQRRRQAAGVAAAVPSEAAEEKETIDARITENEKGESKSGNHPRNMLAWLYNSIFATRLTTFVPLTIGLAGFVVFAHALSKKR
ncbi:MAG: hypothetical protein M1837_002543 [Sclerophora amabilis]|nr:MAG: hypothetical protein M1837_002543 [Sclerophora amabilis]